MANIVRCSEDDPQRCQHVGGQGQCINKALLEGGKFCEAHGGGFEDQQRIQQSLKNYQLDRWKFRADLERKCNAPDIKSLRDEVAILRMLMEQRLMRCDSEHELILQSQSISELVSKIERTVAMCHKLEGSMGQHLDKTAILNFASAVINIIGKNVEDGTIVNNIANDILTLVGQKGDESF